MKCFSHNCHITFWLSRKYWKPHVIVCRKFSIAHFFFLAEKQLFNLVTLPMV